MINGKNNILKNNRNNPPIIPNTKANTANTNEKIRTKGVNAKSINTNINFKANITNKNAMKISITNPDRKCLIV